jgi:hypothetical protein
MTYTTAKQDAEVLWPSSAKRPGPQVIGGSLPPEQKYAGGHSLHSGRSFRKKPGGHPTRTKRPDTVSQRLPGTLDWKLKGFVHTPPKNMTTIKITFSSNSKTTYSCKEVGVEAKRKRI